VSVAEKTKSSEKSRRHKRTTSTIQAGATKGRHVENAEREPRENAEARRRPAPLLAIKTGQRRRQERNVVAPQARRHDRLRLPCGKCRVTVSAPGAGPGGRAERRRTPRVDVRDVAVCPAPREPGARGRPGCGGMSGSARARRAWTSGIWRYVQLRASPARVDVRDVAVCPAPREPGARGCPGRGGMSSSAQFGGMRTSGMWFDARGCPLMVSGFGFRVSGFGFRRSVVCVSLFGVLRHSSEIGNRDGKRRTTKKKRGRSGREEKTSRNNERERT
jgi:hypothetical protein